MERDHRTSIFFDRDKFCFVGLDGKYLQQIKDSYAGIDVDSELKKMGVWLCTPKGRRRKGNIGFIIHWLNNTVESNETKVKPQDPVEYNSPLQPYLLDYLQDLWKGKEHILEFNKVRSS